MKKYAFCLFVLLLLFSCARAAAQRELYGIGFYNIENLFDTIHDDGKNDYEFLPEGKYKWGTMKYTNKIRNIAALLADMGSDELPCGMAVVGVCEVENSRVLDDLLAHEALARRGWKYVHAESADKRGIDCALLYNPEMFKPVGSRLVPYTQEGGGNSCKMRGFLVVTGCLAGEPVHFIVNHWPSRYSEASLRERAALLVRELKDSLMKAVPESKVIIMGDMNDDPDDRSMNAVLGAVWEKERVKKDSDLYNPWWSILRKEGKGTSRYQDKWNLFDQIVLSGNLIGGGNRGLKLHKAMIFSRAYMFQQSGRYKGVINRTHIGNVWLNGYSDHLPVVVYLEKVVQ